MFRSYSHAYILLYLSFYLSRAQAAMQTLHEACMQPVKEALRYLMGLPGPSGYGSSSTAEQVASDLSASVLPNLTAIITGATSGIGVETATALAKAGVRRLVIPARDVGRGDEVRERIRRESPGAEVVVMEMDLSSPASIRSFCFRFLALHLPLNILINNAGRYSRRLHLTEDKYEMTLATNYLGHYILTDLLLPKMAETASETGIEGRIVNVSSRAHSWVKRDVLPPLQNLLKPHKLYDPTRAYAYSKLANILHTMELARQLKEGDVEVTVNAVHPGTVKTGIIRDHEGLIADSVCFLVSGLLKSPSQGASTTCYVALCPRLRGVSGRYFADCNERSCSSLAQNAGVARNLWLETNAIVHKGDDGKMAYTATGRSSVPGLIRKQEIRMDRDEY